MSAVSINTFLKTEKATSDWIPYTIHVSPNNVKDDKGNLITVIKVEGAAHESADVDDVQLWHESLHGMLRNIAADDIAIWRHTLRRRNDYYPAGEFHGTFARQLNDKYRESFAKRDMMQNDLYITLVLRAEPDMPSFFGKKADRARAETLLEMEKRSAKLDEIAATTMAALQSYKPTRLGCYERNGIHFSDPMKFLGYLINGTWTEMPLPRSRIGEVLASGRATFGVETGEIRGVTTRRLFAMVTATDYPEATETGLLTALLTLPFEYVLTHSFAFIAQQAALAMVITQQKKLLNTKDAGQSQIEDLDQLKDDLTANRVAMGEHHFDVLVYADDEATLVSRLSQVAANLSNAGFGGVVREDLCLEAAFYAQLPGQFKWRARPAPITTRNFAGLIALHNFPVGHATGNQWGPAVTVLRTTAGSPFYFNFHLPRRGKKLDLKETDDGEGRVAGHTMIVGPTGSGKTVDATFLLSQAEKYQPTTFTFDKDYGQEAYIRGQGGQYNTLAVGERTHWNPFHLEPTPRNIEFLDSLMEFCCGSQTLTAGQVGDVHTGVRGVMSMPFEDRNITTLAEFLPSNESNGPYQRLQKWIGNGKNAWIFDNHTDCLSLKGTRHFGFDVTEFIEIDELRTAIVMYLYHRMEALVGTRRFIMVMEEFWKLLGVPVFAKKADDAVRTWRKRDAFAVFLTQGPREILQSPVASSLKDACVTQIYKPNPKADYKDYVEGMKLSEREFEIIAREMPETNMRGFLYKQGTDSVVCELNLQGFSDELAVLSTNSTTAQICRRAIARAGNDPELWLPVYHQYRRGI